VNAASFQCSLDNAAYAACTSPKSYTALTNGTHTFAVRAVSSTGVVDATPASQTWTVTLAPDTTITASPAALTASRTATFQFTATLSGGTFQCSLDNAAFATCVTGVSYTNLTSASHNFRVRAISSAGIVDATPASYTWTVDAAAPVISAVAVTPALTGATITWTTNEAADSIIDYGTSATSLTLRVTNASLVTSHSMTVSGLASGTTYYYRITSRDGVGNSTSSPSTTTASSFVTRRVVTQAAASVTIQSGTLRGGSASSLSVNDNTLYSVNSTTSGTRTAAWYGSFTSVPSTMANLLVNYSGLNSRSVTQTVEIFQWTTNTWVALNSTAVSTTEVALNNLAPSGAASSYVSSGGEVRVRIRAVGSNQSFYTAGDFLQIRYDRP
jgi:hypothetical protein